MNEQSAQLRSCGDHFFVYVQNRLNLRRRMLLSPPSMVGGAKMKHPCVSKTGDQMDQEVNSATKVPEGTKHAPTEKRDLVPITQGRSLQTVPLASKRISRRWLKVVLPLAVVIGGAGGGTYWWLHSQPQLPPGIA